MENHSVQMGGSSGSSTAANSRWNPTKEQISMLENLYKQGVRTPSAEQIQQITARLRAYGHIEGKNVFYWFQNHKARQRQKQKQETIAYFNRFLHRSPPIFPSPLCPNVLCAPYYQLPQNEMQFYPQHPKVLLPSSPRRRPRSSEQVVPLEMPRYSDAAPVYEHMHHPTPNNIANSDHETLALFPLQPTGILEAKTMDKDSPFSAVSADNSAATHSGSSDIDGEDGLSGNQPLIDFFSSGQAS